MKAEHKEYAISHLCELFGNSRQAYYEKNKYQETRMLNEDIIMDFIQKTRDKLPRIGTRKLHFMIKDEFKESSVVIGRDALFELLAEHNMLVRRKRSSTRTTYSNHRFHKYPNLIRNRTLSSPNEVWVSDITYIRIGSGFLYLFLITDAYSRKIVGWELALDLSTEHALTALKMAVKSLDKEHNLTHHSDRGTQYCCHEYIDLLNKNNISISMTENGDPLENAIAERVNGILKTEWINDANFSDFNQAKKFIKEIVHLYNNVRPHQSISYLTPEYVHTTNVDTEKQWKNYYKPVSVSQCTSSE